MSTTKLQQRSGDLIARAKASTSSLEKALQSVGLSAAFDRHGVAFVNCPGCGHTTGLKLSLQKRFFHCGHCGRHGPLETYLTYRAQAHAETEDDLNNRLYDTDNLIVAPRHSTAQPGDGVRSHRVTRLQAQALPPKLSASTPPKSNRLGETIIISIFCLLFFVAGLAAAALSGFANFSAFAAMVADPVQARIWGWSGVIASVVSFGGFTIFWWHYSARRWGEAFRALIFALAGAATSLAGTALYMQQNQANQVHHFTQNVEHRDLLRSELSEVQRQFNAIPAETRSIEGLEAYLIGVEQVGRTHHKAYREAQNELGQARRRARLQSRIAELRADLRAGAQPSVAVPVFSPQMAWIFAILLEVFSSQGTSIGSVALIILFSRAKAIPPEQPAQD